MFALLSLQDIVEFYLQLCDYVKFFLGFPWVFLCNRTPGVFYIFVMCKGYLHTMVRKRGIKVVPRERTIYMRDIYIPDKYVLELVNQHNYVIQKIFL